MAMAITAKGIDHERITFTILAPYELAYEEHHSQRRTDEKTNGGHSLDAIGSRSAENCVSPGDPGEYPAEHHDDAGCPGDEIRERSCGRRGHRSRRIVN